MSAMLGCRVALCSLALSLASGCVVIPHRGKVFGPGGSTGSVDLRFLRTGATYRDEVRSHLAMIDVKLPEEAAFWGRWRREWNVYWIAAGGGQTSAVAGGGKETIWRRRNVLIEFDATGRTSTYQALGDSELLAGLSGLVQRNSAKLQTARAELALRSLEGEEILFQQGRVHFAGRIAGTPRFACEFTRIETVKVASESTEDGITLRLSASVPGRTRVARREFTLTPRDVFAFVNFATANGLNRILVDTPREQRK